MGNNPSFTWRSIIWGRDLFKKGFRWRVGDGNLEETKFQPSQSQTFKGEELKEIMDNQGTWLDDKIVENFSAIDAETILNTPTNDKNRKDEIIWSRDKKGQSSVKSAYHLAVNSSIPQGASSSKSCSYDKKWRPLWKIKGLPRVKICAWRTIHDSLLLK